MHYKCSYDFSSHSEQKSMFLKEALKAPCDLSPSSIIWFEFSPGSLPSTHTDVLMVPWGFCSYSVIFLGCPSPFICRIYSIYYFFKWHKETFGCGGNVYFLDRGNSFKFVCMYPNSLNCTQYTQYRHMQFSVYQFNLNKTVRKITLDHYSIMTFSGEAFLQHTVCFTSPLYFSQFNVLYISYLLFLKNYLL